jgi:hypothetical protein
MKISRALASAALLIAFVALTAQAGVTRFEVTSRTDVLGGKSFGSAGPYEKIVGKVYFTVDPANAHNKTVVNIDKAPRDAQGLVEFSADIEVLAPKDPTHGNGVAFFEVPNRGRKAAFQFFNHAPFGPANEEKELGDGLIMQHGFTVVWVGWQFSLPKGNGLIGIDLPIATANGQPVPGRVMTSFTPNKSGPTFALDADTVRYPPVNPASDQSQLTVVDSIYGTPHAIARDQWQFGRMENGQIVADTTNIYLKEGFESGQTYELTYEGKNAVIGGLGLTALRDVASAFKHQPDAIVKARYAYAFGQSQTGRFLREFLYEGFNADEQGQRVFDAVWAHIAGAARADFSVPFSEPNGLGMFTGTIFPYSDLNQHDPGTGKTDGLLSHMNKDVVPKIFYTNGSCEYWGGGRAAALIHTTVDGKKDEKVPDNVRIYMLASTQHIPSAFPPGTGQAQQKVNPNDYRWVMRSAFLALDRWVREGTAPPPSRYPNLSDGTLVPQQSLNFPSLDGVRSPLIIPGGYRSELGGPLSAPRIPYLVSKIDADGNEAGGIRLPEIAVPLATYTGWNFRNPSIGGPTEIIPLTGSYIPFATTRAEREKNHDPRMSIEERYPNRDTYVSQVKEAATKLAQQGYLLSDDVTEIVATAGDHWDYITNGGKKTGESGN